MVLTLLALYLFSRDSIPIETSSLLVVAVLAIGFSVFPHPETPGGKPTGALLEGSGEPPVKRTFSRMC